MRARLLAISGPLKGASFAIAGDRLTLGRDEHNEISLDDRSVSRRHCEIVRGGERFYIRDLGAVNRTHVNNLPVAERRLAPGLRCLLHVVEAVSSVRGLDALAARILELLAEAVPARHYALLLDPVD